LLRVTAADAD